jgi:hypothetical protein
MQANLADRVMLSGTVSRIDSSGQSPVDGVGTQIREQRVRAAERAGPEEAALR